MKGTSTELTIEEAVASALDRHRIRSCLIGTTILSAAFASLFLTPSIASTSTRQAERGPMRYETTVEQVTYQPVNGWSVLVVRDGDGRCFAHKYGYERIIKGADRANALLQAKEDGDTVILTADPDWSEKPEYRDANCLYLTGIEIREKGE